MSSNDDAEKIDDNLRAVAILDAREQRAEFQRELIKEYKKTLISVRVNYPGLYKDNHITRSIMDIISSKICSSFSNDLVYKEMKYTVEGPHLILIVDMKALEAKKIAVQLEDNHPLGRFADIDVYNTDELSVSRTELGLAQRKCYLCNDIAHNCVRSRRHSMDELLDYINGQYIKYKEN